MKQKIPALCAVTAVCVVLGMMIGLQYKTVKTQQAALLSSTDGQRVSELTQQLAQADAQISHLQAQIDSQQERLMEYETALGDENGEFASLVEENEALKRAAGQTSLVGRGVTVTIRDSKAAGSAAGSANPDAFLVHAEDLLSILNELNVAGAEAISINGERLVSQSAIRCSGSVVTVNDTKVAAPFVITAIGDPDLLEAALVFPGGVVDTLKPWGIEITIVKSNNLEVPAYRQMVDFTEGHEEAKG